MKKCVRKVCENVCEGELTKMVSVGFKEGSLRTFVRIAPDSVFLFFGRHSMWPSVYFWRNLLTRKTFASAIDTACSVII